MLSSNPHIADKLRRIEVVLLACSAGGFKILFDMLQSLSADLPIAVVVIIHRNARYETKIEASMSTKCRITVKVAEEKEPIAPGVAYFAPPGYHLLIEPDRSLSLDSSEPVNFCRPSIDVTMQSAADVYGAHTAAVLLSGANQDGASGLQGIQQVGGLCIAQDPRDAEIKTMPAAAIDLGAVDIILRNEELLKFSRELHTYILTKDLPWRN